MTAIGFPHIAIGDDGIARVEGTTTKVLEIAWEKLAHDWSAEEIHYQHPHLSMAQIHAALTYYYDHMEEVNAQIDREKAYVRDMRAKQPETELMSRLQAVRKQRREP